jgi:hypothetical protein
VARELVKLTGPDMRETGRLYIVREKRFGDYVMP